jgi:hypothetical protein
MRITSSAPARHRYGAIAKHPIGSYQVLERLDSICCSRSRLTSPRLHLKADTLEGRDAVAAHAQLIRPRHTSLSQLRRSHASRACLGIKANLSAVAPHPVPGSPTNSQQGTPSVISHGEPSASVTAISALDHRRAGRCCHASLLRPHWDDRRHPVDDPRSAALAAHSARRQDRDHHLTSLQQRVASSESLRSGGDCRCRRIDDAVCTGANYRHLD